MPYIDGQRVSAEEWQERFSTAKPFYTGPDGDNPAPAPELDEETGAPKSKAKPKSKSDKAGGKRSPRSEKAAKAAVADALGVKTDSPKLDDIDVSGLDAPASSDADASSTDDESSDDSGDAAEAGDDDAKDDDAS